MCNLAVSVSLYFFCAAYPVQVSGHQLVTVPASIYQTVVANIQQQGGDGGTTVQMLTGGTPIQISGVTGSVIMKQEPSEAGGGISLTPVSISNNGQVSYCYSRCLRT